MKSCFVLATALVCSLPTFGQATNAADQIRALDKGQRDAALRGDTSLEVKYNSPDCITINPKGVLMTRERIVSGMKSGNVTLDGIEVDQEQAHVYGDTVVVTGREHVRGHLDGHAFENRARYSRVWTNHDGAWKLVLFQETPIVEP